MAQEKGVVAASSNRGASSHILLRICSQNTLVSAVATPLGQKVAHQCANANGNSDGLIRMLVYHYVGGFRAFDGFFTDLAGNLLATCQGSSKTLSRLSDFLAGDVCCGRHKGLSVFGQFTHVVADCFSLLIHTFLDFGFVVFFGNKIVCFSGWTA